MKLFHLSDLHIGKTLNGYSLAENQELVLGQIIHYAKKERPDAILICGDIYDRSVPSGEAYQMFDRFLTDLSEIQPEIPVLLIAGNHDSPQRLAYAEQFLEKHHIYISVMPPQADEEYMKKITLTDEFGSVHFYLLPFTKPGYLRGMTDAPTDSYEAAVQYLIQREHIDKNSRNILLSHQFYTGHSQEMELCESEQAVIMAGGLDKISCDVVKDFDYVALGHLHGKQQAGYEHIRYCGTPFKYSVSEEKHNKSITVVTINRKEEGIQLEYLPLQGKQDVRKIRGTFDEVMEQATEENRHDFVSVTITDEEEPYHFREKLKETYDCLLEVRVDNIRTREKLSDTTEEIRQLSPMEAFSLFYETVNHTAMTEEEQAVMEKIFDQVQEVEV